MCEVQRVVHRKVSKDVHGSKSQNMVVCYITQQKVVCRCDSVNDLKWGDYIELFRWTQSNHVCVLSGVQLSVTPWTVAHQAPVSVAFSRQEYWSG